MYTCNLKSYPDHHDPNRLWTRLRKPRSCVHRRTCGQQVPSTVRCKAVSEKLRNRRAHFETIWPASKPSDGLKPVLFSLCSLTYIVLYTCTCIHHTIRIYIHTWHWTYTCTVYECRVQRNTHSRLATTAADNHPFLLTASERMPAYITHGSFCWTSCNIDTLATAVVGRDNMQCTWYLYRGKCTSKGEHWKTLCWDGIQTHMLP